MSSWPVQISSIWQRKLTEETDEDKIRVIARLLAEERAKLTAIDVSRKLDKNA